MPATHAAVQPADPSPHRHSTPTRHKFTSRSRGGVLQVGFGEFCVICGRAGRSRVGQRAKLSWGAALAKPVEPPEAPEPTWPHSYSRYPHHTWPFGYKSSPRKGPWVRPPTSSRAASISWAGGIFVSTPGDAPYFPHEDMGHVCVVCLVHVTRLHLPDTA